MKRFNLLLVSDQPAIQAKVRKSLSKAFRKNFVFHVRTLAEAQTILRKLHIDLLLIDLDHNRVDLEEIGQNYPRLRIMGLHSAVPKLNRMIKSQSRKVLPKGKLQTELYSEVRNMRKGNLILDYVPFFLRGRKQAAPSPNYKDFARLIAS